MNAKKLRIIPLGGLGEIGKNMMAIEYGRNAFIIDAGGMFPDNDMLGVDLVIPDFTEYLKEKKDYIRAIFITHGHEDHIGALAYFLDEVGAPVYATRLTAALIENKLDEHPPVHPLDMKIIAPGDSSKIGPFEVEFFHACHSIPDAIGLAIRTPLGLIVHTGDFKFDYTPVWGNAPDFGKLARYGDEGTLLLLSDSTNAENPGFTPSEQVVTAGLERVFRGASGRIIIATFGSLISRVQQIVDVSVRYNRKVMIDGRSMVENVQRAIELGYMTVPDHVLVEGNAISKLTDNKVVIIATGSQGEPSSALSRMSEGKHRHINIREGDTVVMSARTVPGNEKLVSRSINRLFQRGAKVIYGEQAGVHVSGHASQEELKLLINLTQPRYFVPIHGEMRHLQAHANLARNMGIPDDDIFILENGMVLELDEKSGKVVNRIPGGYLYVDGTGVGDIGPAVLRDREILAQDGFVIAVVRKNKEKGEEWLKP
jgi:ribonuclease J